MAASSIRSAREFFICPSLLQSFQFTFAEPQKIHSCLQVEGKRRRALSNAGEIAGPLGPMLHFSRRHYCESRLPELLRKAHRVQRSAADLRADQHHGPRMLGLKPIARDRRFQRSRSAWRKERRDRSASLDDRTLEFAVFGRVGCAESISYKCNGWYAGTQRAAMRGNVNAGGESANDRLAEVARELVGKRFRLSGRRPAADDRYAPRWQASPYMQGQLLERPKVRDTLLHCGIVGSIRLARAGGLRRHRHKGVDGVMSVYVVGPRLFVFDVGTPREHVGSDSYRADWKSLFASLKGSTLPSFGITEMSVAISGDVAFRLTSTR